MLRILHLICSLILLSLSSMAQLSDIVAVQKKNGRNVRTFGEGSKFNFYTTEGNYVEGYIHEIRDDSIFITSYDIRAVPTRLGITIVDTFAVYQSGFNYKEVASIQVSQRQKLSSVGLDKILMIGGAGYFLLNVVNSGYLKQSLTDGKSLTTLGISAAAFGTGLLLNKTKRDTRFSGKKHKIVYIKIR